MNKCFWGAVLVTLALGAFASADTLATIEHHFVDESIDFYDVPLLVEPLGGGPPDEYADAGIGLISGSGLATDPLITAIVPGTVYSGHTVNPPFSSMPPPGQMVDIYINLATSGDTVQALGSVVVFTLDLTPFSAGDSFPLTHWFPPQLTQQGGAPVPIQAVDGSITITPEPGTLVLSTIGLLFGLAWMGRRRKSNA